MPPFPHLSPGLCRASVDQLPTLDHVRGLLLQAKRNRAAGPDGIPPELGLLFADHMSRLLHPLVLKLALRGSEAIGFKAGLLARLYKNKVPIPTASTQGHLAGTSAFQGRSPVPETRVIHAPRGCRARYASEQSERTECDFGSHAVRTFLRLGRHQHKATAAVFTDIESAYYASTRELAIRRIDLDVPDEVLEGPASDR